MNLVLVVLNWRVLKLSSGPRPASCGLIVIVLTAQENKQRKHVRNSLVSCAVIGCLYRAFLTHTEKEFVSFFVPWWIHTRSCLKSLECGTNCSLEQEVIPSSSADSVEFLFTRAAAWQEWWAQTREAGLSVWFVFVVFVPVTGASTFKFMCPEYTLVAYA